MKLSSRELCLIIEKASTLSERLSGDYVPVEGDIALAERRLARWKQMSAGNDSEKFVAVLRAAGKKDLSERDALPLLGAVRRRPDIPWPVWTAFLQRLVPKIARVFIEQNPTVEMPMAGRGPSSGLPFAALLDPIGEIVWGEVEAKCPFAATLGNAARRGLQAHLLRRYSDIISVPLHSCFSAYKALEQPDGDAHKAGVFPTSHRHYRAFVLAHGSEGMKTFFLSYPVVARLLSEISTDWIGTTTEFLRRFELDRPELAGCFNQGRALGRIVDIQAGLSDPHHEGRTVAVLTSEGGLKLVYKPRSLQVDQRFFGLVQTINAAGLKPALRALRILDRGEYGWMEFARHEECINHPAVQRFYRRAGALAMLAHWLQGIDCHRGNLIAAGEHPMLIDLETLAHPLRGDEVTAAQMDDPWSQGSSPLRTGLLPFWQARPGNGLYNNTGLGAPILQRPLAAKVKWENLHSDRLTWKFASLPYRWARHRPRQANRAISVSGYTAEVLMGFRAMARLLAGTRRVNFARLRDEIYGAKRRWVKRPTVAYAVLMRLSLRPEHLLDGIERSFILEALPHRGTNPEERAVEIACLAKLDIPYFWVPAVIPISTMPVTMVKTAAGDILSKQMEPVRASLRKKLVLADGRYQPLKAIHHVRIRSAAKS